jgi:hypothetical protein
MKIAGHALKLSKNEMMMMRSKKNDEKLMAPACRQRKPLKPSNI